MMALAPPSQITDMESFRQMQLQQPSYKPVLVNKISFQLNSIAAKYSSTHQLPALPHLMTPAQSGLTIGLDGKRVRKSITRKTVDQNSSILHLLEKRAWTRDIRDTTYPEPDPLYTVDMLPPEGYLDNPYNAVTTKFVRAATNKIKCPIFCVAWTPDGRRLITGASSGEFTLWNGLTFNFETILQAHDTPVRCMIWSHNDQWMVTADHGGYIKYWQCNMNNVKMFPAHKDAVRGLSFSPTDHKLASCADDGTVRIWDFERCFEEKILRGHGCDVKCIDWHPSKSLLASGSKDNQQPVKLWDPKSGNSLATIHSHKGTVMSLGWNQFNGNWLLTASRDHSLKLFDIRNFREEFQVFKGHKKDITSLAWHPIHEGLFVSGSADGTLLYWTVGNDKELGVIEQAHDSIIWSLNWHPLGHILVSGSNDHSTKFWTRPRPGDLLHDKETINAHNMATSYGLDEAFASKSIIKTDLSSYSTGRSALHILPSTNIAEESLNKSDIGIISQNTSLNKSIEMNAAKELNLIPGLDMIDNNHNNINEYSSNYKMNAITNTNGIPGLDLSQNKGDNGDATNFAGDNTTKYQSPFTNNVKTESTTNLDSEKNFEENDFNRKTFNNFANNNINSNNFPNYNNNNNAFAFNQIPQPQQFNNLMINNGNPSPNIPRRIQDNFHVLNTGMPEQSYLSSGPYMNNNGPDNNFSVNNANANIGDVMSKLLMQNNANNVNNVSGLVGKLLLARQMGAALLSNNNNNFNMNMNNATSLLGPALRPNSGLPNPAMALQAALMLRQQQQMQDDPYHFNATGAPRTPNQMMSSFNVGGLNGPRHNMGMRYTGNQLINNNNNNNYNNKDNRYQKTFNNRPR